MAKYIRFRDLMPDYGIPFSRTHIKRLCSAEPPAFPQPVYLGAHTMAWEEADILAWREQIRAERDAGQTRRRGRTANASTGTAGAEGGSDAAAETA